MDYTFFISELFFANILFLSVAVGEDKPGTVRLASLSGSGTEKSSSQSCGIFPSLHLRHGLMNLPEATDPFGIKSLITYYLLPVQSK